MLLISTAAGPGIALEGPVLLPETTDSLYRELLDATGTGGAAPGGRAPLRRMGGAIFMTGVPSVGTEAYDIVLGAYGCGGSW